MIQTYTTAVSGTCTLIAVGASGGTGFAVNYPNNAGGSAAQTLGAINLPAGFTLDIAVGSEGASGIPYEAGGGGGAAHSSLKLPNRPRSGWCYRLYPTPPSADAGGAPLGHGRSQSRGCTMLSEASFPRTAFSAIDSPILSRWAKVLTMIQLVISLSVVAVRAVNIL